jgi:RNA polymerase sigma-70 factor, ECF subfamily
MAPRDRTTGDPRHMSDEEAIVRVLAGEADAFAAIVHRYRDNYARFATRMVGNRADAEDVLQLAFVRAYRALDQCRNPARFGPWFYQIVVNECRAFATRRTRRERWYAADESALAGIAVEEPAAGGDGPTLGEIQRALDQLPVEQREAFVLKHVEEVDYETMSELTGAGVSALKMRVKRACDRLRELLEEVHRD